MTAFYSEGSAQKTCISVRVGGISAVRVSALSSILCSGVPRYRSLPEQGADDRCQATVSAAATAKPSSPKEIE